MKVAIIGAGFSGLAAGLELAKNGAEVEIFESQDKVGGLAVGFKEENWDWTAEKFYHHIFTNDSEIISLSIENGIAPKFSRPKTCVYWHQKTYPFDSPIDLLKFPGLNLIDKLRMGLVLAVFKLIPNGKFLERWTAENGLKFLIGENGYKVIWEPLLTGKFSEFSSKVNLAWFWARIKKRTSSLGTFPGGFQTLADRLAGKISGLGGKIHLNIRVDNDDLQNKFDAVLSTHTFFPTPYSLLPTPYLDAHVLFLELNQSFLPPNIYWLNILDRKFPFLVVCEHTNFVGKENFGGKYLLYIGNYLPKNHRLFTLPPEKVVQEFLPWLIKINLEFSRKNIDKYYVFHGKNAQPVMTVNYSRQIPQVKISDKLYGINQAMIYPWDRGINYAAELGKRAARMIINDL
ncbi:FAD-dependent oxidoreductase [Candidatus Collierbacteria bacterium]|nr:FAD-dependent oxidoreductase [Candidatus Collierbacteria bacterium]